MWTLNYSRSRALALVVNALTKSDPYTQARKFGIVRMPACNARSDCDPKRGYGFTKRHRVAAITAAPPPGHQQYHRLS